MTTYLVTRHPGALEWAGAKGIAFDIHCAHMDGVKISPGDTVIGTLPVHLAAEICARGGRFLNLSLDLPMNMRGRELDRDSLEKFAARIEQFHVEKLP